MKVLQFVFHWPSLFKDAHNVCCACDKFQILGKISRHHMIPLNPILVVDVWGNDFVGPFSVSFGYIYILVGLTMCRSGLKQCLVGQQTTGWCSKF